MRTTPEDITDLAPGEVFVFGSNEAGIHGAGAARLAARLFGAVRGKGAGEMGQCYGIPTKDAHIRTLPVRAIASHVLDFLFHAASNPEKTYLVTQIGCGLAGYGPSDIAPLFRAAPSNVVLPASFVEVLNQEKGHP